MAMIAVEIVLQKLTSLVEEEVRLLGGVRKEVKLLRDDLESMKSCLQDAEERSESNKSVKTWVKQVREVAYDVEDVLDEFLIRFNPPSGHGFSHSCRKFYRYFQQLIARHRLAAQIQSVKENVRAISDRRNAFSFNRTNEHEPTASNSNLQTWHDPRVASLYMNEADVVGIEGPKSAIVAWLLEEGKDLSTTSVVGMGGIGKTTLVKKVFDSQPVKSCFDCHAWVTVYMSMKTGELLQAVLNGFLAAANESDNKGTHSMNDLQLADALREYLKDKRYVIVFDNVCNLNVWEVVKYALPDYHCGSRIIFTSRLTDIAASKDVNSHIYHLQPLPEKEALKLFCRRSFQKDVCPEEFNEVACKILKKCMGLPLAIVVIGGMLSKKEKNVFEWNKVHDSISAEMKKDHSFESLWRIFKISYNDLPYYLKSCYLYLSVFPEDYIIKRTKLTRLWIAERMVEKKPGLSMEEVAEQYLDELVKRSLIQVVDINYLNKVTTCRIHDLIRDILQSMSQEELLVEVVNGKGKLVNEKVRRMSMHGTCDTHLADIKFQGLRSLLFFKSENSSNSSLFPLSDHLRLLRVLELELAPMSHFPPELTELIHLRYLSLRRTLISQIPESIGKLQSLETLDLKATLVTALPIGILKLKNLSRLCMTRYHFGTSSYFADTYGIKVPIGIGNLTSLQKLGSVELNGGIAKELEKLTELKKLGVIKVRKEDEMQICSSLEKMRHLTSFYIVPASKSELFQLNSMSSPPPILQRLYLKCGLTVLPKWIAALQHLSKLVLQDSCLDVDLLAALQDLPNLIILDLRAASTLEELCCNSTGYPRLKMLGLYEMQKLKQVKISEGAMPGLKTLHLAACEELESVPWGIEHLRNVEDLMLWDMPYTFLMKIQRAKNQEFWKVRHIPTIKHVYDAGGRWATQAL